MGRVAVTTIGALAALFGLGPWLSAASGQRPATQPAGSVSHHRLFVNRYCVSCHNERLSTGGLALDQLDIDAVPANPAV